MPAYWHNAQCSLMIRETGLQSHVDSYLKQKKWYLMPLCLKLRMIWYRSRVSGAFLGKKWCHPLHFGVVAIEKGAFSSSSTTVD